MTLALHDLLDSTTHDSVDSLPILDRRCKPDPVTYPLVRSIPGLPTTEDRIRISRSHLAKLALDLWGQATSMSLEHAHLSLDQASTRTTVTVTIRVQEPMECKGH